MSLPVNGQVVILTVIRIIFFCKCKENNLYVYNMKNVLIVCLLFLSVGLYASPVINVAGVTDNTYCTISNHDATADMVMVYVPTFIDSDYSVNPVIAAKPFNPVFPVGFYCGYSLDAQDAPTMGIGAVMNKGSPNSRT